MNWFSCINVRHQECGDCLYCFQRVSDHRRGKEAFIWRTLTHTAVHESCYHSQRSTGNAVYHFRSVLVCLGLRCVIRSQRESDASEENTHRSCYQPPHMSVCMKTPLSKDDRSLCCLVQVQLFVECEGFGKRGAFHFCFLNELSAFSQDTVISEERRDTSLHTQTESIERSDPSVCLCVSVCVCVTA